MSEKTYRIEEYDTTGWELVDKYERLTKDKAKEVLELLMAAGYNPNRLRAIPDGTTTN